MTKIIIKELVFDEFNRTHKKTHHGRYLIVSRVEKRIISVVIRRISKGVYYIVTARDADKKERRELYEKEIKNT